MKRDGALEGCVVSASACAVGTSVDVVSGRSPSLSPNVPAPDGAT